MTVRSPLLTADFDGNPVRSIDTLLFRGVGDERRRERVEGLAALVDSADIVPVDRYYACLLLTAWGEQRGYLAVQQAARQHRSTPLVRLLDRSAVAGRRLVRSARRGR